MIWISNSIFSGGGVAQWASSRLLSEDPGSIPGTAIPPTRQGGCQVPRWGSEVMKRYLAGKSTVRIRRLGIAGLKRDLARRCDKPTLHSNSPACSGVYYLIFQEVKASPCANLLLRLPRSGTFTFTIKVSMVICLRRWIINENNRCCRSSFF